MIRLAAAVLAFAVLASLWPGWRGAEAPLGRAVDEAAFVAETEAFATRHQRDGTVRPPPGPVPMLARRFEFWPAVTLEPGQGYVLRLMAQDGVHSVVVDGREMLLAPGHVQDIAIAPGQSVELRCNEYCGLGHNRMRLKLY